MGVLERRFRSARSAWRQGDAESLRYALCLAARKPKTLRRLRRRTVPGSQPLGGFFGRCGRPAAHS